MVFQAVNDFYQNSSAKQIMNQAINLGFSQLANKWNTTRQVRASQELMNHQDALNRNFYQWSAESGPSFARKGYEQAGFNPLLAIANSTGTSGMPSASAGISDSDQWTEAVNSALDARRFADEHKINEATVSKIQAEVEGQELDNKQKKYEFMTSPKKVISDFITGSDNPTLNFIKKVGKKLGINTSAISSYSNSDTKPVVINLGNGKPYVQKGVPKSVVKRFNNMINSAVKSNNIYHDVTSWNSSNHKFKVRYLTDEELKHYKGSKRFNSSVPKYSIR